MKLTIERFDGDPTTTIDDRGAFVHLRLDGSPDALELVFSRSAYDRFVEALTIADGKRTRVAGVRVGIEDVTNVLS